jgi:hypothetical protein
MHSRSITSLLDQFSLLAGYKHTYSESQTNGCCVVCGKEAKPETEAGKRNFTMSGTCETCWRDIFKEDSK